MSRLKGNIAEDKALEFLKTQGFTIIEQNFYAKKLGEIDIISKKEKTYHFIEVKSATDYEIAVNNVTVQKLGKLKRSVDYYLQKNNLEVDFCIDVIIVVDEQIELLENITL